mmetsp:Transcript_222/g.353  ORF Transcript_222/g.353 Transcript_222/m.353 type:complete len:504 (-) Transcript_222:164-1675(-)|eukprot:CAMPEP_0196143564 /NCGR_PEP_ID=MMETSP0910-20130528/13595_1 /TAXON_ID=49265 /ORGANISM="Thalassiosira rotula, Strain GSO102" /LENGTH=503 /DNA_ID=CAMNT_0041405041 /DNA_START=63 /DNA_END=1574 /DNA_ORIENTATION=-
MTVHFSDVETTTLLRSTEPTDNPPSSFHVPKWLLGHFDRDSLQFGVRMSVCLTVSSLFVLAPHPEHEGGFRQGMWVLITVLFVCWFPTLDVASVLEKSAQRLLGTLVGAALGLACGFLSLAVKEAHGFRAQAICLGGCIALVTFAVCSYATARVGQARLIEKKNYATILCMLTFTICLVPFYSMSDKPWEKSILRVRNVVIGCFLGVGLSMMVFPRPTVPILEEKLTKAVELAGESAEAVLHTAADVFAENAYQVSQEDGPPLSSRKRMTVRRRKWRNAESDYSFEHGHDSVFAKCEAAMKDYKTTKARLGMLKYDPFNIGWSKDLLENFKVEVNQTLSRSMRIQTTVVLMDGIIRNDPNHKFSEDHLDIFASVGTLIRSMLSARLDVTTSDAIEEELRTNLVEMRRMIVDLAATVSASPEAQMPSTHLDRSTHSSISSSTMDDDKDGAGTPKHVEGSHVCSLLFLQLAEHLAIRSVRLYESRKQCDGVSQQAKKLRTSLAVK